MKTRMLQNLLLLLLFSSGCATVATGKFQDIPVTSEPQGIKVKADTGESLVTPGRFLLQRNRSYTLIAEYPGSEPQQMMLKNKVQGWFWGNILIGGVVGGIVDVVSGSCDELVPKNVHFNFTQAGQEIAERKLSYIDSHPDIKEEVRFAILNEFALRGMTKDELIASFGEPNQIVQLKNQEQLIYENRKPKSYIFKNGKLRTTE